MRSCRQHQIERLPADSGVGSGSSGKWTAAVSPGCRSRGWPLIGSRRRSSPGNSLVICLSPTSGKRFQLRARWPVALRHFCFCFLDNSFSFRKFQLRNSFSVVRARRLPSSNHSSCVQPSETYGTCDNSRGLWASSLFFASCDERESEFLRNEAKSASFSTSQ